MDCGSVIISEEPKKEEETAAEKKFVRGSWDEYFMDIARAVAKRSTCLHRQIGAVLVKNKRIIATGYNGAPKGIEHCNERGTCRKEELMPDLPNKGQGIIANDACVAVHSEANAIVQAAVHGVSTEGATAYCTTCCCSGCAKMFINAGIKRCVYDEGYPANEPDKATLHYFKEAGIEVVRLESKKE